MGEEETEKYARMFACALPHVDFPMGFSASPISAHNMNLMPTDYQHGFDQLAKTARPNPDSRQGHLNGWVAAP